MDLLLACSYGMALGVFWAVERSVHVAFARAHGNGGLKHGTVDR